MQIYPLAQLTHIMVRLANNQAFISAISRNVFTSLFKRYSLCLEWVLLHCTKHVNFAFKPLYKINITSV